MKKLRDCIREGEMMRWIASDSTPFNSVICAQLPPASPSPSLLLYANVRISIKERPRDGKCYARHATLDHSEPVLRFTVSEILARKLVWGDSWLLQQPFSSSSLLMHHNYEVQTAYIPTANTHLSWLLIPGRQQGDDVNLASQKKYIMNFFPP